MKTNALIISLRYPEPGAVKKRLAEVLGDRHAARLYRVIAEQVLRQALPLGDEFSAYLYFTPAERKPQIESWMPWIRRRAYLQPQMAHTHAECITHSFQLAFGQGAKHVAFCGTDCLEVDRESLTRVFEGLEREDAIIGPSNDGGIYLFALRATPGEWLNDLPWGEHNLCDALLEKLEQQGLSFEVLPDAIDIDTREDLAQISAARWAKLQPALKEELRLLGLGHLANLTTPIP